MAYVTSEKSNVDQLIGGTAVAALTKNITLKGLSTEKALKRGAVLAVSEGKYQIVDAASAIPALKVANAVLAEDVVVGTGDVVATVYIRGIFNAEEMSVGAKSDSVQAHEEELRAVGIYLTHLQ
nr:MAG TPA: Head decoration protein, Viral protein.5A [Caudoviricetes sp.]